jgi:surfactin synthase thioesterase subunit
MSGSWLVPWHQHPDQRPMLLCVPPAGAGCGQFVSWQAELGDDVSVLGVQLPGREARWADPEPASMDDAVAGICAELAKLGSPDQPIVIFGHSFGALLGYEIAKYLRQKRGSWPHAVVVAACRPPHMWVGAGQGLVDDEGELARLLDARGLGADDLDEDSRDLMLEVLRRDARLSRSYRGGHDQAVGCALEAWGGEDDDTVTAEQVVGWRHYAAAGFRSRMFPGGHYFYLAQVRQVLDRLGAMTREPMAVKGGGAR